MNKSKQNSKLNNVSDFDLKIIQGLQEDGRVPMSQLAKKLNVSTGMVRLHYQKLVESGVVQVAAITNPLRIGHSRMAMIGIKTDGHRLREVANEIAAFDEVIYLVLITGSYDLLGEIVCRDKDHLLEFLTNKLYKVEGVKDSETFMFLEIVKEDYL